MLPYYVLRYLLIPSVSASVLLPRGPPCKDVYFTVSATALGRKLLPSPNVLDGSATTGAYFAQPVIPNTIAGTQKIYGQYCQPLLGIGARSKTLHLLVHGITYDHTYWNGLLPNPDPLNLQSMAGYLLQQGYPTLTIDRLGVGKSDHPDPVNVVQAPYQRELYHAIIGQLRGNSRLPMPTNWQRIIWIGHSYGSIVGTQLAATYPTDVDAMILTGIARRTPEQNDMAGILLDEFVQASAYDPRRFPPAVYAAGYFITSSKTGRQNTFYSRPIIDFSPLLYNRDFDIKETITIGEILTEQIETAPAYNRPLFVISGQYDAAFCGDGSRAIGAPNCGSGQLSQLAAMKDFFPAVAGNKFGYFAQPNAGHAHQMHFSARLGFAKVGDFLRQQGF